MKTLLAILVIFSRICFPQGSMSPKDNSRDIIEKVISSPIPFATGTQEKQVNRLGGKAAIEIIKIVPAGSLAQPEQISRILAILQEAFAKPEIVSNEEDRTPEVSQLLLAYLQEKTVDAQVKVAIRETSKLLEQRAAEYKQSRK